MLSGVRGPTTLIFLGFSGKLQAGLWSFGWMGILTRSEQLEEVAVQHVDKTLHMFCCMFAIHFAGRLQTFQCNGFGLHKEGTTPHFTDEPHPLTINQLGVWPGRTYLIHVWIIFESSREVESSKAGSWRFRFTSNAYIHNITIHYLWFITLLPAKATNSTSSMITLWLSTIARNWATIFYNLYSYSLGKDNSEVQRRLQQSKKALLIFWAPCWYVQYILMGGVRLKVRLNTCSFLEKIDRSSMVQ